MFFVAVSMNKEQKVNVLVFFNKRSVKAECFSEKYCLVWPQEVKKTLKESFCNVVYNQGLGDSNFVAMYINKHENVNIKYKSVPFS